MPPRAACSRIIQRITRSSSFNCISLPLNPTAPSLNCVFVSYSPRSLRWLWDFSGFRLLWSRPGHSLSRIFNSPLETQRGLERALSGLAGFRA